MNDSIDDLKERILNLCDSYKILVKSNYNEFALLFSVFKKYYDEIENFKSYDELENHLKKFNKNEATRLLQHLINNYRNYDKIRFDIFLYSKRFIPNDKQKFDFVKNLFSKLTLYGASSIDSYVKKIKDDMDSYSLDERIIVFDILDIIKKDSEFKSVPYYNEVLSSFVDNIDKNDRKSFIRKINKTLSHRNNLLVDNNYRMNYEKVLFISSIDNRVTKDIRNGKKLFDYEIEYLRVLNDEMIKNPYLFFSLPLSNLREDELLKLKDYLNDIDTIIDNSKKIYNRVKNINNRYDNISKRDSVELYKFLSYYVNINRINNEFKYDKYVEDLLNSNELTYDNIVFLLKYLGYSKCIEDELFDSEISICNFSKLKDMSNICGMCASGIIFINKDMVNKKNLNDLLVTLFHELRHMLQRNEVYNRKISQMAYDNAILNIINYFEPRDYDVNYKECYSELDADKMAYNEVIRVYSKYKKDNRQNILNAHKKLVNISSKEKFTNRKSHITGNLIKEHTAIYEKKFSDMYFKKNPSELEYYPIFKKLYLENGKTKELDEFLVEYHSGSEQYYYNFFTALVYEGKKLNKDIIVNRSIRDRINMIRNLDNIFNMLVDRLFLALDILNDNSKEKSVIRKNILFDIKIGNNIIIMFNNILNTSNELIDGLNKTNSNLLDHFNENKILFNKLSLELKNKISLFDFGKLV